VELTLLALGGGAYITCLRG